MEATLHSKEGEGVQDHTEVKETSETEDKEAKEDGMDRIRAVLQNLACFRIYQVAEPRDVHVRVFFSGKEEKGEKKEKATK